MAIPAEFVYGGDQREFQFRDRFILPLLVRLGFGVVANYHGQREFGRDAVFGDIDRFGHVVYYGMQIKYESSISLSDSHGLIQDAAEATHNPFKHPHTGRDEFISCFYVANAGDISDVARSNFFSTVVRKGVRDARLLDANALLLLDKSAALNRGGQIREKLSGLLQEVRRNVHTVTDIGPKLIAYAANVQSGSFPMVRCRNTATGDYLGAPFAIPGLVVDIVEMYWEISRVLNAIADSVGSTVATDSYRSGRAAAFAEHVPSLLSLGRQIEAAVDALMARVGTS